MTHTRQVRDWCRDNQYYQQYLNFNEYDFVNMFPKRDYEILDMEFHQPSRGRGIEV